MADQADMHFKIEAVIEAVRPWLPRKRWATADSRICEDLGVVGDDGDDFLVRVIEASGMAIRPDFPQAEVFGSEGMGAWLVDWLRGLRRRSMTIGEIASYLIDDPALAEQQKEMLKHPFGI